MEGGAWRQGWDIKYDDEKWTEEPLNVFVVCILLVSNIIFVRLYKIGSVHALAQRSWLAEDIRGLFPATNQGHYQHNREYSRQGTSSVFKRFSKLIFYARIRLNDLSGLRLAFSAVGGKQSTSL